MSETDRHEMGFTQNNAIPVNPPLIWPDNRILAGVSRYAETPPCKSLLTDADLINGVIVGAGNGTVDLIEKYLASKEKRNLVLVLVLFPAGPTRSEHLKRILTLIAANDGGNAKAEIRLITMEHHIVDDSEHIRLPPTVIQAHDTKTSQTVMSIGSVGDAGHDESGIGSLNLVFHPDDAVRDEWRRWFQYLVWGSVLLTPETCDIPYLVPAKGDPEATRMWESYKASLKQNNAADEKSSKPQVDPQTGEVIKLADGTIVVPWDNGVTALDPLASIFQKLYADAWLVTVDETTRLKPLKVPVKATLLGQQTERAIGTVTQKQSFTLQVLDDSIEKEFESCRTAMRDLLKLLSFPLSNGNHLLHNDTKAFLEQEVAACDKRGREALWSALTGQQAELSREASILDTLRKKGLGDAIEDLVARSENASKKLDTDAQIIQAIIDSDNAEDSALKAALVQEHVNRIIAIKRPSITNDLNEMYQALRQGTHVPAEKLEAIIEEVRSRLTNALSQRITPRPVYNRIAAPDLTAKAPDENWMQPFVLLTRAAKTMRESLTDPYFSRNFTNLTFSEPDYLEAIDVFGDTILQTKDTVKAQDELRRITEINDSAANAKQKCQALWNLIKGDSATDLIKS